MENKKKIDDLFKDRLGSYSETPPPAVWDALEKRLDPSRKPRGLFTKLGYMALLGILVAISVIVARNTATTETGMNTIASTSTIDKTAEHATAHIINTNNETPPPTDAVPSAGSKADHKNDNSPASANTNAVNANTNTPNNTNIINTHTNQQITQTPNNNTGDAVAGKEHSQQRTKKDRVAKTKNKIASSNTRKKHSKTSSPIYTASVKKNDQGKELAQTEQPENEYNNAGPANKDVAFENKTAPLKNNTTVADDTKAPVQEDKKDSIEKNKLADDKKKSPKPTKIKPKYTRFEAGVKVGYEFGFSHDDAQKAVLSPYVQYKISPRFAIMLQPAIKYASVSSRVIGVPKSYYKTNNDGKLTTLTDSIPVPNVISGQLGWIWNYTYTETHDSIVKKVVTGGNYTEFEVPVLLKFYITKEFSVYGGVNIAYSRLMGLTENTYISKPIMRMSTAQNIGVAGTPPPPLEEPLGISYSGLTPYSNYTGPQYPTPKGNLLRFGYMVGFSYEYDKWLFDALIQQGSVSQNMQGGYNTNTPLADPYIRLTIGYKLTK